MAIKSKIQTKSEKAGGAIFSAIYINLLIYNLTALFAAGGIWKQAVDLFKANLKRKQNLLPNDVYSSTINSVMDHFATPTSVIIAKMVSKLSDFSEKTKD